MATGNFNAGFDFKRLPGNVTWGSKAFYRKTATQDARLAMKDIIAKYEQLLGRIKGATPEAMEAAMKPIFKRAQFYVPEKTGALWESGKMVVTKGAKPKVTITFGNEEAWYAAIVHEFVWLAHEAPTRSKYLQAAMEEGLDKLLDDVGSKLRPAVT